MQLKLEIVNPIDYRGWDELLISNQDYSFFHSSSWAKVLYQSYHYKPLYFTLINNDKLSILIPFMEVKSIVTGRRAVSLPFTDYCNLIIADDYQFYDILNYLIRFGAKAKWRYLELRSENNLHKDLQVSLQFFGHTLDIYEDEKKIFSTFRSSTKRNINKAIKEGVQIDILNSLDSIKEFYQLNCITRKRHGLPPQPFFFLKNIFNHIISKNLGMVMLASHNKKIIASAVYFHFGKKAIYKYGASDYNFQHLRANNLIMWEAIKWYAKNGYINLCFGKTEPENSGLRRFKAGWGSTEKIIKYYKYNLKESIFTKDHSNVTGIHNTFFNKTPIPLLKIIGSLLYKHMA
ncbi:MAG: lipid II:glycine glycyltransferase FemX [Candidatus Hodarchaeota archaeon]